MKRSKLKPTLEEAFAVGKLEGQKEAFKEMEEMVSGVFTLAAVKTYLKARLKTLAAQSITNPFKQKV